MKAMVLGMALGLVLTGCSTNNSGGGPRGSAYIGKTASGQEVLTRA